MGRGTPGNGPTTRHVGPEIPSRFGATPGRTGAEARGENPTEIGLNLLRAGDNLKHPIMSVIRYEVPY